MSVNQNDDEESVINSEEEMEGQSEFSSDDERPILLPRENKRQRRAYLNFNKVVQTFPDVSTDIICKLAEMKVIKPSNVLKLVPGATTAQIAEFLSIAEQGDSVDTGSISNLDANPSQLGWLKSVAAGRGEKNPQLPCPTNAEFIKELEKLVPPKDGGNGNVSVNFDDKFNEKFQDKLLALLGSANPSTTFDSEYFEKVYKKLAADPLARSRIENLHAARAHKYGHAQFGPKFWYRESLNLAKKWNSQDDRRKFRIGLKGLVDFLNQLNIKDLEKLLHSGDSAGFKAFRMPEPMSPAALCSYLKSAPPIKIIECMNKEKAASILKLLGKISSLAHFSQSMADFFARDDALEPALAVVCEVLRKNQDVGGVLQEGAATFMSLAQPFDKHKSAEDRDAVRRFSKGRVDSARPYFCFAFQRNRCKARNCPYTHKCTLCKSKNHGKSDCTKSQRERSRSQKRSRARKSQN